jgi:hypothetical protein
MATFNHVSFVKQDDYMTPRSAWEDIKDYIPKGAIIWESAYGDGTSGAILRDMGYTVIHEPIDYFNDEPPVWDIQITNPPFSRKKEWFQRAKDLMKPFIILCPISMISTQYIRKMYMGQGLQVIIPKKRIHFIREGCKGSGCNFDCFYYCWNMNMDKDLIWL